MQLKSIDISKEVLEILYSDPKNAGILEIVKEDGREIVKLSGK